MQGWIKLYRCLIDKPIWACSTPEQKAIFITILLLANHTEKEWEWRGKKFICKPGQFITSSTKLAVASGCTRQNVRTALKRFKNYGFITYESTKSGLLITVVNWEKYQGNNDDLTNELTNRLTNGQPTPNQRLTTTKNDKNDKNDKKKKKEYPPDPNFDKFWEVYPKKVAKMDARKAWEELSPDDDLVQKIISAVKRQRDWPQWRDKQYIPYPATWLRGRRWEDTLDDDSRQPTEPEVGLIKFEPWQLEAQRRRREKLEAQKQAASRNSSINFTIRP